MSAETGIRIFSLTDRGAALASSIRRHLAESVHVHGGADFAEQARNAFTSGYDCIFICSTGIVIRTLAPALAGKTIDPAVVVMDEQGKYVVPLLSSHEGGAAILARALADNLGAQYVVTSARDYSRPVFTAGMGCERNCPLQSLESLLGAATQQAGGHDLAALSSISVKADETGLLQLAKQVGLTLTTYPASVLRKLEDQLTEKSEIVFREVGCYGVAEAAALYAASELTGEPAELVVSKIKGGGATVAIARSFIQE